MTIPQMLMMSAWGQKEKYSLRAYVFRFAPGSGHREAAPTCPFRAITGLGGLWLQVMLDATRTGEYRHLLSLQRARLGNFALREILHVREVFGTDNKTAPQPSPSSEFP